MYHYLFIGPLLNIRQPPHIHISFSRIQFDYRYTRTQWKIKRDNKQPYNKIEFNYRRNYSFKIHIAAYILVIIAYGNNKPKIVLF